MSTPDSKPKPRSLRVLACVLCQQRKVKCDRTFPCSNCTKHNVQCVPATQPRQRRRRFPERELLDRLRKYEALMRENNVKFEPLHEDNSTAKSSPNDGYSDREQEDEGSQSRSESVTEVKNIWHAMRQGYPNDSFFDHVFSAAQDASYQNDDMLFGSRQTVVELCTLHPEPAHLFRLWQVYLDNVNPLLMVTHTPTLQSRIVEAASNLKDIPPTLEALMFSIYCMAILSLTPDECEAMFKQSKDQLQTRFQFGCQQALSNSNFLRTSSRDCLTALFLYLIAIRPRSHPKSVCSMLAVAVRIAQRMGLQNEYVNVRHSVLEAEMRRRLWWSLVLFDSRISALSDVKPSSLMPGWDCAMPMNVSDSELREETKTPPKPQEQATEAIFTVIRSEFGDFIRNSDYYIAFTNPVIKPLAKKLPGNPNDTFERMMEDKYLKLCDPDNRIHFMTIWIVRAGMATCRLMNDFLFYLDSSKEYTAAHHEAAVSYAMTWLECDTKLTSSPLAKGFRWFLQIYFPFPAYVRIIQHLKGQPFSSVTERAWKIMNDNYEARNASEEVDRWHPVFKAFTNIVMSAWEIFRKAYKDAGKEIETPEIIDFLNRKTAELSLESKETAREHDQSPMGMDMDDMQMSFGFGDPSMFLSMGSQPGFDAGTSAPYMPNHTLMTVDMNQLSWNSMTWGLGQNGSW